MASPPTTEPPAPAAGPALLRSRFARRVVALFVLSALVPTLLLAALSFGQVQSLLEDLTLKQMHQESKHVGMGLMARLTQATDELTGTIENIAGSERLDLESPIALGASAAPAAAAASRSSANSAGSCPNQRSKPKRRPSNPGATSAAISAASIGRVPDPHMGSTRAPPARATSCQPACSRMAAARFSLSGAIPPSSR